MDFYRTCLKEELSKRCERNPRYSLRAFASSLDVDAGALSRLLNGKQFLSKKLALTILKNINLEPADEKVFLESALKSQMTRELQRFPKSLRTWLPKQVYHSLDTDLYRIISDWYHVAILELTYVENFKSDARWIASQLDISIAEAKLAVDRLVRLGLLEEKNGQWKKSKEQLTSGNKNITNSALRKQQKQFLEKAIDSLEQNKIHERSITSMTMAIDPAKIPIAKKMIQQFNRDLCQFLESGKRKKVYNLEICLNPLQQGAK